MFLPTAVRDPETCLVFLQLNHHKGSGAWCLAVTVAFKTISVVECLEYGLRLVCSSTLWDEHRVVQQLWGKHNKEGFFGGSPLIF